MSTSTRHRMNSTKFGPECSLWSGISYLVYRLATYQKVRGSNPGAGLVFPRPSKPTLGLAQSPIQYVAGHSQG